MKKDCQDIAQFSNLPEELILNVFEFLDPESLCHSSKVCKQWTRLSSGEDLWRVQCIQKFPELAEPNNDDEHIKLTTAWKNPLPLHRKGSLRHLFGPWLSFAILLCFLLCLAGVYQVVKQHYILATFVPASAVIKASEIIILDAEETDDDSNFNFAPTITYIYDCDDDINIVASCSNENETMTSSDLFPLSPLTNSFGEEEYANKVVSEYPVGLSTIVYRDPNDCSDVFLLRYTDFSPYLFTIVSVSVIYLIVWYVFRHKKPKPVRRMTRKFDHNFKQWLYELAPVAEQKFNFAKMIKINAFLVLILHVFGTLLFLHFFLYAEEKKEIQVETSTFYTCIWIVFQVVTIIPLIDCIKYYRLKAAMSEALVYLNSPSFALGNSTSVYFKIPFHQSVYINQMRVYISRHSFGSKNKLKPSFSRSSLVISNRNVEAEELICETHIAIPQSEIPSNNEFTWFLKLKIEMKNLPDYIKEMEIVVNKQ